MLGQRIKELRSSHGLTQQELGRKLSLSKQTISGYEKGARHPSPEILQKLADVFSTSTDYLLGRTEDSSVKKPLAERIADSAYKPESIDLEELLERSMIRFHGEPLLKSDKDKLLQIAKILWEERQRSHYTEKK
ncbi:helix-turn-helix domain-containing protein [Heliorestis convoluta]|uniref:Helix-turn-helix family protein n=1 Tax=Heliorestis convoluta TaxID=356322 RepID=A0A5Q2N0X1_9FIRM|nr:helix-turn-helix transcriptional regulator [Heliorestis convoluta]QGG47206.1 helix-turn-helix family protein [Heliorestis convoluta]